MDTLGINFSKLKSDAIEGTFNFFGKRHLPLLIDLSESAVDIDGWIDHFPEFVFPDYLKKWSKGMCDDVIHECEEEYTFYSGRVNVIRSDDGYRENSVNFGSGNDVANEYCLCLFRSDVYLDALTYFKTEMPLQTSTLNKRDDRDNKKELSLREIALFYYYENIKLKEYEANNALLRFRSSHERTTYKKLMFHYKDVMEGGLLGIKAHKNAVENITNVIQHLKNPDSIKQALHDLDQVRLKKS